MQIFVAVGKSTLMYLIFVAKIKTVERQADLPTPKKVMETESTEHSKIIWTDRMIFIPSRHLSDNLQTLSSHLSDTFQIPSRSLPDIF